MDTRRQRVNLRQQEDLQHEYCKYEKCEYYTPRRFLSYLCASPDLDKHPFSLNDPNNLNVHHINHKKYQTLDGLGCKTFRRNPSATTDKQESRFDYHSHGRTLEKVKNHIKEL